MEAIMKYKNDREMPETVRKSIEKAYGHDKELYAEALEVTRYDGLMGCWCHGHCGMYVGIEEEDGYMHT